MADIFISYAREDKVRAQVIVEILTDDGYSVFWDDHLRTGQSFRRRIERELRDSYCVIVLWSAAALESDWVEAEALVAFKADSLFSVMLEAVELPLPFGTRQAHSLVGWRGSSRNDALLELLADVDTFFESEEEEEEIDEDSEDVDEDLGNLVLEFLEHNSNVWFNAVRISALSEKLDYPELAEYDSADIDFALETLWESGEIYRKRSDSSGAWLYSR